MLIAWQYLSIYIFRQRGIEMSDRQELCTKRMDGWASGVD